MNTALKVVDKGRSSTFTYEEMLKYHGYEFPGGVAHSFKVLERALPLLSDNDPPERREIRIETAFRGPGARDGFEMVTRAVTDSRYLVDPDLERKDRGQTLERYVFRLHYRDRSVTLIIREGLVVDEFIKLARQEARTEEEESRLTVLKQEMADRLMSRSASDVYDVVAAETIGRSTPPHGAMGLGYDPQ